MSKEKLGKNVTSGSTSALNGSSETKENVNSDKGKLNGKVRKQNSKRKQNGASRSKHNNSDKPSTEKVVGKTSFRGQNDPKWYAQNAQLVIDAASLPYSDRLGQMVFKTYNKGFSATVVKEYSTLNVSKTVYQHGFPGIFTLGLDLSIGQNYGPGSPLSLAATRIFSKIRKANSGRKNYEEADVIMYLLAMDQIYAMLGWGQRAYNLVRTYMYKNAYIPKSIVEASGFNYDSIMADLADFRYRMNSLIANVNILPVPKDMYLMARHADIFNSVFRDSDGFKTQFYVFKPITYGVYEPNLDINGGMIRKKLIGHNDRDTLKGTQYGDSLITADTYFDILEEMIAAVNVDEDIAIMAGDILKAYAESDLYNIGILHTDSYLEPKYDPEILLQIHNATLCSFVDLETLHIRQENQFPYSHPAVLVDYVKTQIGNESVFYRAFDTRILDMPKENPTPIDNMIASRFSACIKGDATSFKSLHTIDMDNRIRTEKDPSKKLEIAKEYEPKSVFPLSCGSEIVLTMGVWFLADLNGTESDLLEGAYPKLVVWNLPIYQGLGSSNVQNSLIHMAMLSNFSYHPALPIMSVGNEVDRSLQLNFSVDNYTIVDARILDRMHRVALLSLLGVADNAFTMLGK